MFSVVFMLSWFLCAKPAFAGSKGDWMKLLSDTLPVCKLSIPGTHDSGAIYGGCMLKTQDAGIFSQLELGIRAFDRSSWYGTSRKRNDSGCLLGTYQTCKTCRYGSYGYVPQEYLRA